MDGLREIPEVPSRKSLKKFYFDFFQDFRDFLAEYVRESVWELCISEVPIKGTVKLFDGFTQGKVKLKNQGLSTCYISTTGQGGYKLDPGETTPEFFVNKQVVATTLSGATTLGLIKT